MIPCKVKFICDRSSVVNIEITSPRTGESIAVRFKQTLNIMRGDDIQDSLFLSIRMHKCYGRACKSCDHETMFEFNIDELKQLYDMRLA